MSTSIGLISTPGFVSVVKIQLEFGGKYGRIGKLPTWNLEEILDQNQSGLKRNGLFQWNQQSQWNGLIQSESGRKVGI